MVSTPETEAATALINGADVMIQNTTDSSAVLQTASGKMGKRAPSAGDSG